MPLEWLGTSREPSLPDLIARRKYGRAIALLRSQLERDKPTTKGRLQLADLLVQAGRKDEAIPVFLELADDFAREGFVAKAIAVLKRVGRLEPDQDVSARLEELVRTQQRLSTTAAPSRAPTTGFVFEMEEIHTIPPPPPPEPEPEPEAGSGASAEIELEEIPQEDEDARAGGPEIGMEALAEGASPPEASVETEPGIEADAEPEIEADPEPEPELEIEPDPEGETGLDPEVEPEPEIEPDPEPALADLAPEAPPEPLLEPEPGTESATDTGGDGEPSASGTGAEEPAAKGVRERIHNAFKRFLKRSLPGGGEGAEAELPEMPDGPATTEEAPIEVEESELGSVDPAAEDDALSEEAFRGQVLDTIQGALQSPPAAHSTGTRGDPARRLLATPLFHGLDEGELLAVVQGLELRTCRAGDVILSEGERGDQSLYVITSGQVRVFVRGPNGRNVQLGTLTEGEFFGEMSGLSGRPRTATITAASDCELLELARPRVDEIARRHPRVRDQLDQRFVQRASSPEAAAVRAVPLAGDTAARASSVLAAHFGESRWDPRMRLRLARLLIQSGKEDDAVPVLITLADDLSRSGQTARAVALIKKVEQIQNRHIREIPLAPLSAARDQTPRADRVGESQEAESEAFQSWLVDVVRRSVVPTSLTRVPSEAPLGYGGLQTSPLFAGFSEDELVALFASFTLRQGEPGEILVTEGERSDGVFVLCSGRVRVWVRDPSGHDVELCELGEGAFFGEVSTLSGRPRSATVCAASACELLELERDALETLAGSHPRVRRVLEEFVAARTTSEQAARIRGHASRPESG